MFGRCVTRARLALLALVVLGVGSPSSQAESKRAWTVMVYLAADCDMETGWVEALNRFTRWKPSKDIQFVFYVDRSEADKFKNEGSKRWTGASVGELGNWHGGHRFTYGPNGFEPRPSAVEQAAVDTGDGALLSEFVRKAAEEYPANHYALLLGGHGQAWRGTCQDGGAVPSSPNPAAGADRLLTSAEIAASLAPLVNGGERLELLGFLSCNMASLEVLQELAPVVRWCVASEDVYWTHNWVLEKMGSFLAQHPNAAGGDVGEAVIRGCDCKNDPAEVKWYQFPKRNELTLLSLIELEKLPAVMAQINELGLALLDAQSGDLVIPGLIGKAREHCFHFNCACQDVASKPCTQAMRALCQVDLRQFMLQLADLLANSGSVKPPSKKVQRVVSVMLATVKALEACVRAGPPSNTFAGAGGLQVLLGLGDPAATVVPDYGDAYAKVLPGWLSFLNSWKYTPKQPQGLKTSMITQRFDLGEHSFTFPRAEILEAEGELLASTFSYGFDGSASPLGQAPGWVLDASGSAGPVELTIPASLLGRWYTLGYADEPSRAAFLPMAPLRNSSVPPLSAPLFAAQAMLHVAESAPDEFAHVQLLFQPVGAGLELLAVTLASDPNPTAIALAPGDELTLLPAEPGTAPLPPNLRTRLTLRIKEGELKVALAPLVDLPTKVTFGAYVPGRIDGLKGERPLEPFLPPERKTVDLQREDK